MRVSSFMIVRNAIENGYPFLESILSVLKISDEIIISDGYSTDGTWEVLKVIKKKCKKIKLYRDKWIKKRNKIDIIKDRIFHTGMSYIGYLTNKVKNRCKGDYILYLQADEIYSKELTDEILKMLKKYPDADMFYLPFVDIMPGYIKDVTQWKVRIFKNVPYIKAYGDAATFTYTKLPMIKNYILNPLNLRRLIMFNSDRKRIYVYTKYPIYHFHIIFPKNYMKKIETHKNYMKIRSFNTKKSNKYINLFKKTGNLLYIAKLQNGHFIKYNGKYPNVIRDIIYNHEYKIRKSIIEKFDNC